MAPMAVTSPAYEGPKALAFSKYASPAQLKAQLASASSLSTSQSHTPDTAIATKQQIAAVIPAHEITPPAAELAVEQGTALKKEVEDHTAKFSRAVSNAVLNTRQLLNLLRESTDGSELVDKLWQELEQLFEAAHNAKTALPEFMEKQRDNMSLYHSSMMNETIRETQEELSLQHKKVNTQHNLILEQQNAFQDYKHKTASKLKEIESLHERVSRLTLEKGNFRTEVDKYKELLEQEALRKAEELAAADHLQKELETLVSSKKQLEADNAILRQTTTDMLEQLKQTEQRVTDRFSKELAAKAEELQKESAKIISLNALVSSLRSDETATKKELDKVRNENRLLSVKYSNQAAEHATAFTKMNDQAKKIEALTADLERFQRLNADKNSKLEAADGLTKMNKELLKAKEDLTKQLDSASLQVSQAKEDVETSHEGVRKLRLEIATKDAALAANGNKALLEKVEALEEKKNSLEITLAEWTELAKRSYKEYKDTLVKLQDAEKHRQDPLEKDKLIADLKKQLASAKASPSNGVGAAGGGDSAYWKQKYEGLLASL